jgi:acetate kinase
MKILVMNGGSSGLKSLLCEIPEEGFPSHASAPLWEARVDWGRRPGTADIQVSNGRGDVHRAQMAIESPQQVIGPVLETLTQGSAKVIESVAQIDAVGHRIVHGGRAFRETTRIGPEVKREIARLVEFAPEHNRLELEAIEVVERRLGPDVPQIAVFDTAFHASLPEPATVYPGPFGWLEEGIRRYGFHGISHQYTSARAAEILARESSSLRMVTCHLGNGCSLAAIRGGKSVDTTMGFTPLEGLMMGTRSGSIDPGIIIYLVRHCGYHADELDRILNKESGLKGLSGLSGDMREILRAIEDGNARAKLAFDVFAHRLCREIGAMIASLEGLDALVFTAGIGENCPPLREAVCGRLAFLGVELDREKNRVSAPDTDIASPASRVRVLIVHTEEDWEIARECFRLTRAAVHGNQTVAR